MMIEKTVLDYLEAALSVPVSMEVPEQPVPEQYVVVEKTGGSRSNYLWSANIAVQSCARSLYDAACLNELVKAAMLGVVAIRNVTSCRLDTDYNFTDTTTKQYRYQAIFRITYLED